MPSSICSRGSPIAPLSWATMTWPWCVLPALTPKQLDYLKQRRWDHSIQPQTGTKTQSLWQTHYPVWLGADRRLSKNPLPFPGKVQVTGHVRVPSPDVNEVRIRIDTSGGSAGPLTACLLKSTEAAPVFIHSK